MQTGPAEIQQVPGIRGADRQDLCGVRNHNICDSTKIAEGICGCGDYCRRRKQRDHPKGIVIAQSEWSGNDLVMVQNSSCVVGSRANNEFVASAGTRQLQENLSLSCGRRKLVDVNLPASGTKTHSDGRQATERNAWNSQATHCCGIHFHTGPAILSVCIRAVIQIKDVDSAANKCQCPCDVVKVATSVGCCRCVTAHGISIGACTAINSRPHEDRLDHHVITAAQSINRRAV